MVVESPGKTFIMNSNSNSNSNSINWSNNNNLIRELLFYFRWKGYAWTIWTTWSGMRKSRSAGSVCLSEKKQTFTQINTQTWLHSVQNQRSSFWRRHNIFGWLLMVFNDTGVYGDFVTNCRSLTPSIVSLQMSFELQDTTTTISSTHKSDPRTVELSWNCWTCLMNARW